MTTSAGKVGQEWIKFLQQLRRDERRHQFYSRALAWVIGVLLVAIGVLAWVAGGSQAPQHPDCRWAGDGALAEAVAPMALELAGTPQQVRQLLRGGDAAHYPTNPAYTEAMCIEARAARHRRLLSLDSALFIPLYTLLGLAAVAWHTTLAVRARGAAWAKGGQLQPRLMAWAMLSLACLATTAALDAQENQAAHTVLDRAVGANALSAAALPEWADTVSTARQAALGKWLASAAWATTLAMLAALQRTSLSTPRGSARRRRSSAAVAWLLLITALLAALAQGAGALWGQWAPASVSDQGVLLLLSVGMAAFLVHGMVLVALHLLNLPPRLRLPENVAAHPAGAPAAPDKSRPAAPS